MGCRTFPRHASSPSDVSPSWSFPPRTFPRQDVSPSKTFPRQVGLSQRTFPRQRRFPTNHWGYGQNVRWSICPGQNVSFCLIFVFIVYSSFTRRTYIRCTVHFVDFVLAPYKCVCTWCALYLNTIVSFRHVFFVNSTIQIINSSSSS